MSYRPATGCAAILAALLSSGVVTAAPWEPTKTEARTRLEDGREAFKAGDYRKAGVLFVFSDEAEANLNARWNAAQSFAAAGDWKRASGLYDSLLADRDLPANRRSEVERRQRVAAQFVAADFAREARKWQDARTLLLKLVGDPSLGDRDRASASARLDELAKAEAAATVAPGPSAPEAKPEPPALLVPPPVASPPPPSRWDDHLALALIGVGAVGIAAGTGLVFNARSIEADASREPNDTLARALFDRASDRRTWGGVTLGVAAAVSVAGVVKFILVPKAHASTTAALQPVTGGAILVFGGALP